MNPQVTISFAELRGICDKLERSEKALDRIYAAVMTKPEDDEHGNVGQRSKWLENVYNGTRSALGEAGYAVYKQEVAIPQFVRDRAFGR